MCSYIGLRNSQLGNVYSIECISTAASLRLAEFITATIIIQIPNQPGAAAGDIRENKVYPDNVYMD